MKGLVLDGGGVFGIGQAEILPCVDVTGFDFFIGTSIGAVLATRLAAQGNTNLQALPALFYDEMPRIFNGHWWRKYLPITPKYPDAVLNSVLQAFLPGMFGETAKPVFVTVANLGPQRLKVLYSGDASDGSWLAWEIGRAAVAAETYFAPWRGFADGGIFANNPTMVAIAAASKQFGVKVSDLELCSIGTGGSANHNDGIPEKGWTLWHWGQWVLNALLRGASNSMHEYFARSLPLANHCRIQFVRKAGWRMDNPVDMLLARQMWENDIHSGRSTVRKFLAGK